jgi:hypothetical protein
MLKTRFDWLQGCQCTVPAVFVTLRFHIIQETFGSLIITSLSTCVCDLTNGGYRSIASRFVRIGTRQKLFMPINEETRLASVRFTRSEMTPTPL